MVEHDLCTKALKKKQFIRPRQGFIDPYLKFPNYKRAKIRTTHIRSDKKGVTFIINIPTKYTHTCYSNKINICKSVI